jgi:hypothetical protein
VAIICPRCATPAVLSAEIVHSAGRMLRCRRCAATWVAKVHSTDPHNGGGQPSYMVVRGSGRPRFERIVEHDGRAGSGQGAGERHRDGKPASASGGLAIGRRILGAWLGAVAAVVVCSLVIALVFQSAVVGASPATETGQFAGLEIRLVRATVERLQIGNAVVVEGEISNRTANAISVPAVRIAVLSGGSERHAWLHEPAETRLAAGSTVRFRSVLTAPPAGVDEVAFRLADRPETAVERR